MSKSEELNELKNAYNTFYSQEAIDARNDEKDNQYITDFDRYILSAAKDAAKNGKPVGIVNHGWRIMQDLYKNHQYNTSRCTEMGLTLTPVYLREGLSHYTISGWTEK